MTRVPLAPAGVCDPHFGCLSSSVLRLLKLGSSPYLAPHAPWHTWDPGAFCFWTHGTSHFCFPCSGHYDISWAQLLGQRVPWNQCSVPTAWHSATRSQETLPSADQSLAEAGPCALLD